MPIGIEAGNAGRAGDGALWRGELEIFSMGAKDAGENADKYRSGECGPRGWMDFGGAGSIGFFRSIAKETGDAADIYRSGESASRENWVGVSSETNAVTEGRARGGAG
jgi:hypothetical protein